MKAVISSETTLTGLLHDLGICAESVLLVVGGRLVPETAAAKKGEEVDIIFYKHVPPLLNQQEVGGHWKKSRYESSCKSCSSRPAVYLPHTKEHFCGRHFTDSVEKRAKKAVRACKMIRKNERIGIGLSGGKDSFTLLHVLSKMRESLPFELIALTIDEGIPGYRDKAIENACRSCTQLGVEQYVYSFREEYDTTISDISEKGKSNLCSYCGVLRRKILNSKARELNLDRIAIAHNLDDVAQTAMLNLIRNEPLRFARFEQPSNTSKMVPRIRPLRDIREKEVAAYAFLKGHEYGSKCCCPYSRNALRWAVRHELNSLEDRYPGTKSKMASSFNTIQRLMRDPAPKEIRFCDECGEPSSTKQCMGCKMLNDL